MSKKYWIILALFFLVIIVILVGVFMSTKKGNDNTSNNKNTDTSSNKPESIALVPVTTFNDGLNGWYEEVWYKSANSGGEVTTSSNGVTFKAVQLNSRSGIMLNLNKDVSNYEKVIINIKGTVKSQNLTGTGMNGREAPVAVAVAYKSIDGVDHNLLGEDPSAAGQMFWRGFYYLDPTGSSVITNGVKVTQNKLFNYSFDLMTLNPKPKTIEFISLEGAGWKNREGSISSLSVTAE